MMKRIGAVALFASIVLGLSALSGSSASAECLQVDMAKTGNYALGCGATELDGEAVWGFTIGLPSATDPELYCARIFRPFQPGVTGFNTWAECFRGVGAGKEFIRIKNLILNRGGKVQPQWKKLPTTKTFTGSSGATLLVAGGNSVACSEATNTGEITSMDSIGKVVVTFTGCKVSGSGGTGCTIKSVSAKGTGEIVTHTLKGQLGTVKPLEAATEVGVLLEPETTKAITTLTSTKCAVETRVSGDVAGEVTPVDEALTLGGFAFLKPGSNQLVKNITVLSGAKTAELEAYGAEASLELVDEIDYAGEVEID